MRVIGHIAPNSGKDFPIESLHLTICLRVIGSGEEVPHTK